jgi:hypothetical protein
MSFLSIKTYSGSSSIVAGVTCLAILCQNNSLSAVYEAEADGLFCLFLFIFIFLERMGYDGKTGWKSVSIRVDSEIFSVPETKDKEGT